MKISRLYQLFFLMFGLLYLSMPQTGCSKDYSFEGADTLIHFDSTIQSDTPLQQPAKTFPVCALCKEENALPLGSWSFKTGNSFVCGTTTNSGFIGTNRTFTFFGPSACSIDTGLVMTVFLDFEMTRNEFNVTTDRAAFYYYDHFGTNDIFISRSAIPFNVKITSYYPNTRICTGSFDGMVFRPNGDSAKITDGKFKVLLK